MIQIFNYYFIFILITITVKIINGNKQEEDSIKKLRTELFKNRGYDTMAIPVKNFSHTMNVDIDLNLMNVLNLDLNTHILTTEGYLLMVWEDQHLTWKKEEYGGIDIIRVTPDEIFKPDIMLFNGADYGSMRGNLIKTNLLLYSSGTVVWVPPITWKSLCDFDLTNWPNDEQECFLRFGSWTHDGLAINITDRCNISLHDFWENPQWEITGTRVERKDMYYVCCSEPYPDVTFHLRLKRRASIYHYTVFLPVITAMILNLLLFLFPIRSHVRILLSAISLLMLTIILLYLGTKLGIGTKNTPNAIRTISQMVLTNGLTLIWITIAYNLLNFKIELPLIITRVTRPAQWLVLRANESDSINLTNEETLGFKADNSLLVLLSIIDKLMFVIIFIVIISLHL